MYTTLYKDYFASPSPLITHHASFPFPPEVSPEKIIKKRRGVKYWMKKLFWAVSFFSSLFAALCMISQMWNYYRDNPVVTIFNPMDISIGILPFPAITICNINNVQQSKMDRYIKRAMKPNMTNEELKRAYSDLHHINHICRSARTFTERLVYDYHQFALYEKLKTEMSRRKLEADTKDPTRILREASQSCEEMILYCLWMDEIQNCSSLFREIETDYGYCCTFNLIPLSLLLKLRNYSSKGEPDLDELRLWRDANLDVDNILMKSSRIPQSNLNDNSKRPYPYRQIYAGRSSGLSLLLFADIDEYNCTNSDSEGFLVSLYLPLDFPRMRDQSIAIPSGSEVFMSIRPELTIPDDSINSMRLICKFYEKRKCYFGDEFKLKYYDYYTTSNCFDECIAEWTLLECDCIQYYMPRNMNQTVCPPKKYFCTENVRKKIIQKGFREKCSHCLPTCTELEYSSDTTFLKIKAAAMNKLMMEQDSRWNKKIKAKDLSIVHMYFGVDSTYPRQRKEMYGIIEFLSNAGGLLSLFIGFSVMKLMKFLYELTVGLACVNNNKRRCLDKQAKNEVLVASPKLSTALPNFRFDGNTTEQHQSSKDGGNHVIGNLENVNQSSFTSGKVANTVMTHHSSCGTVTTVHIG